MEGVIKYYAAPKIATELNESLEKKFPNPKNSQKMVKHDGGGVTVWGCMSAAGVGNLVFIEEITNKTLYKNILKQNLNQSAKNLKIRDNYYFQQDNDPKHTAAEAVDPIQYTTHADYSFTKRRFEFY